MAADFESRNSAFQGQARKIKLISNNFRYGPYPQLDEEIEQHLTISADGRVWFSGYNFVKENKQYIRCRAKNITIGKDDAAQILNAVGSYFNNKYITIDATDIGDWKMIITNTDGKQFQYQDSLCCELYTNGNDLSDLIRDTLCMLDLFVFDGKCKPN